MRSAWRICVLALLAGCSRQAIDFNNQLAAVHARLGAAGLDFGQALRPIKEGQLPTAEEFAHAVGHLRSEVATVKELSDAIRLPELPEANELYSAHRTFLDWQCSRLDHQASECEQLLGNQSLTPNELATRLQAHFARLRAEEGQALQPIHAAQRRFAEANGLKLTAPQEQ
jgi:hypothetical protein